MAVLSAAAAPAAADAPRPSQAACDTAKLGARDLAECLRGAADKADRDLQAAVEAALKSIDSRQGVMSSQKARWRRSLTRRKRSGSSWRDSECQDVAPFEAGMAAKGGDPRLELHHRQRRRADREPQGALSVSRSRKGRR